MNKLNHRNVVETGMNEAIGQERAAVGEQGTAERLREAVRQQPSKMTLQLAREFGVPEVEVIRSFPADRVTELDVSRWEGLIRTLEAAGRVRVLVSNGAATMEAVGCFGGFSTTGEFFNVQTASLGLHIRWAELKAAFAIEKPGHMDGEITHSIQFFDRTGNASFKVFLSFGESIRPECHRVFGALREQFCIRPGSGDTPGL